MGNRTLAKDRFFGGRFSRFAVALLLMWDDLDDIQSVTSLHGWMKVRVESRSNYYLIIILYSLIQYVLRVDVIPLDAQRILAIPSTCSYLVYFPRCFITGQSRSVCLHLHVT